MMGSIIMIISVPHWTLLFPGLLAASALNNFCLLTVRAITRYTVQQIIELSRDQDDETESLDIYDGAVLKTGEYD